MLPAVPTPHTLSVVPVSSAGAASPSLLPYMRLCEQIGGWVFLFFFPIVTVLHMHMALISGYTQAPNLMSSVAFDFISLYGTGKILGYSLEMVCLCYSGGPVAELAKGGGRELSPLPAGSRDSRLAPGPASLMSPSPLGKGPHLPSSLLSEPSVDRLPCERLRNHILTQSRRHRACVSASAGLIPRD